MLSHVIIHPCEVFLWSICLCAIKGLIYVFINYHVIQSCKGFYQEDVGDRRTVMTDLCLFVCLYRSVSC